MPAGKNHRRAGAPSFAPSEERVISSPTRAKFFQTLSFLKCHLSQNDCRVCSTKFGLWRLVHRHVRAPLLLFYPCFQYSVQLQLLFHEHHCFYVAMLVVLTLATCWIWRHWTTSRAMGVLACWGCWGWLGTGKWYGSCSCSWFVQFQINDRVFPCCSIVPS